MKYNGPMPGPRFVDVWVLHKTLSSNYARHEYVNMYNDWFKERNIRVSQSCASKWENLFETQVVGYYFDDEHYEDDMIAFKLTFGL